MSAEKRVETRNFCIKTGVFVLGAVPFKIEFIFPFLAYLFKK